MASTAASSPTGTQRGAPWTIGHVLLDEYVIERALGQGGMGAVYLARGRSNGEPFAVKRAHFEDPTAQAAFLGEIQTWIDLPPHTHLLQCRFFRTIERETAVFAEYVDGGSLGDWIRTHPAPSIEEVLDLAIQFAWGLDAAHACGLVHQDVKPGNVLLTAGGVAKVSDFGLARGRGRASAEVEVAGMTPAYSSPEQARFESITLQSDIWSYGVSVLEMFTGRVAWPNGSSARTWLDEELHTVERATLPQGLAPEIAAVIRRCLEPDLTARWQSMGDVAAAWLSAWGQLIGRPYPRSAPPAPLVALVRTPEPHATQLLLQQQWHPAARWLAATLHAAGRDPREASRAAVSVGGSLKSRAIAELTGYDDVERLLRELVAAGRTELSVALGHACIHRAQIHALADDTSGALETYRRAIDALAAMPEPTLLGIELQAEALQQRGQMLRQIGRTRDAESDLVQSLALHEEWAARSAESHPRDGAIPALLALAQLRFDQERHATALELCATVGSILAEPRDGSGRRDLPTIVACTQAIRGVVLRAVGRVAEALQSLDDAIAQLDSLEHDSTMARPDMLAHALRNRGMTRRAMGAPLDAIADFKRAHELYLGIAQDTDNELFVADAGATLVNLAYVRTTLEQHREAIETYDRGIAMIEQLAIRRGRTDLETELSRAWHNKAISVAALGDAQSALALYDRAIDVRERWLTKHGRADFMDDLALAYTNKAALLDDVGRRDEALELLDRAIDLRRSLAADGKRGEHRSELANALIHRGHARSHAGALRDAVEDHREATALLETLVNDGGRVDLQTELALAFVNLANTLCDAGLEVDGTGLLERGITLLEHLVSLRHRDDVEDALARARMNRGAARLRDEQPEAARSDLDAALAIHTRRMALHATADRAREIARTQYNRASALRVTNDVGGALEAVDAAIALLDEYDSGASDERHRLLGAQLHAQRASVFEDLGDALAARAEIRDAIAALQAIWSAGRGDVLPDLAQACELHGRLLQGAGEFAAAVHELSLALQMYERWQVDGGGRAESDVARVHMNLANAKSSQGAKPEHLEHYEHAIAIRRRRWIETHSASAAVDLAAALSNKACVLDDLGRTADAIVAIDEALALHANDDLAAARNTWKRQLVACLGNKAAISQRASDLAAALEAAQKAVEVCTELLDNDGMAPAIDDLCRELRRLAQLLQAAGRVEDQLATLVALIARLETRLASARGPRVALELATACVEAASLLGAFQRHREALALCERAVTLREALVDAGDAADCAGDLACARLVRAVAKYNLGDIPSGTLDARVALAALAVEAPRTGRADLQQMLSWGMGVFGAYVGPVGGAS